MHFNDPGHLKTVTTSCKIDPLSLSTLPQSPWPHLLFLFSDHIWSSKFILFTYLFPSLLSSSLWDCRSHEERSSVYLDCCCLERYLAHSGLPFAEQCGIDIRAAPGVSHWKEGEALADGRCVDYITPTPSPVPGTSRDLHQRSITEES